MRGRIMKKLLLIIFITIVGISFTQTTDARQRGLKNPPGKIFYRDPDKFKGKWVPYKIESITYHTYYKDEMSGNEHGIQIKGKANGKNDTSIYYKASSIEEIQYYQRILKGDYKEIRLFTNTHDYKKCGNNNCTTQGIIVEL
jgi:hypothetical protein